MKKSIVILITLLWMVSAVKATLSIDIPIDLDAPGIKVITINDEHRTVNGGRADILSIDGRSSVIIDNGQFSKLVVGGDSTANIYGGDIAAAGTVNLGYIKFHAYDFKFEDDYVYRYDENGYTVRTKLYNGTYGFQVIPEPTTLAMLSVGSIFLFRRRKVSCSVEKQ